jgi:formylglycine-generating enzyme required for sulfatase activity
MYRDCIGLQHEDHAVTPRIMLICSVSLGTILAGVLLGAFATEQRSTTRAVLGSCAAYAGLPAEDNDTAGLAFIPGGTFQMGSERHRPEERFTHLVRLDGFWIDRHEVTNAQFRQFVDATGYVTLAERGLDPKAHPGMAKELLVPGSVVFIQPTDPGRGGRITQWFQYVPGASWRQPAGTGSTIDDKLNHPVVHVAYEDALAYARWRGRELPTEAQWEFAARGGRDGEDDWSSAFDADGKPIANTWQGIFPVLNTKDDGYAGTAPVGCFKPNGYGIYDMIGNVWEWTSDWYQPSHPPAEAVNPAGPQLASIRLAPGQSPSRAIKGGSYLCGANFCSRYRPAARQPQETDLGAAHLGFRTVLNKSGRAASH